MSSLTLSVPARTGGSKSTEKLWCVLFGSPFVKLFSLSLCYLTVVCLSYLSGCDIHVLWPNGWMDYYATWYDGRPQLRSHCVRWRPSSPPKEHSPRTQFLAHVCCGQMVELIKMPLGTEVGLSPCNIVLDGNPAPPKKGHWSPPLFASYLLWPNSRLSQ